MAKEATVGKRVSELIAQLDISKNAFAISLEKTATVIQHLVDERNKPGFDLLCKIFEVYPNVSKDWLLLGAGPMFVDGDLPATEEPTEVEAPASPAPKPVSEAVATPEPAPTPSAAAPEVAAPPITAPPAPTSEAGWQSALYTQQMAHQLALAEMRNQFLQEQQRLMQQMMDLMQRQVNA